MYAADHDGTYPRGESNSNDALAQLLPVYIDMEKIFYCPNSPFCAADPPDEVFAQENRPSDSTLEAGENHFAYVSGYHDTEKMNYPILADGFTAEGNTYDEQHIGWDRGHAFVVYLDGSAVPETIRKEGKRGEVRGKGRKSNENLFKAGTLGPGVVLNPLKPSSVDE
ncbi:MAG: hypothetical protein AAF514_13615 [Verrucomicrobiota bacterium]